MSEEPKSRAVTHAERTIRNLRQWMQRTADVTNKEVQLARDSYVRALEMWEYIYTTITGARLDENNHPEQYEVFIYEREESIAGTNYNCMANRRAPTIESAFTAARAAVAASTLAEEE